MVSLSHIRFADGLDVVEIEDGDEDKGGEAGVEAAVVEDEAAVHLCGDSADDRAHKAGKNTVAEAVLTRKGTKSCREGKAVHIRLCRERPGNIEIRDQADDNDQNEQRDIAHHDGKNVSDMLTVSRKGERGKDDACGRAGKADTLRKSREDLGENEHNVQIREDRKAVDRDIYHTDRHTELVRKVGTVSCALEKLAVAVNTPLVENEADDKRGGKQHDEEHVHKSAVAVRKRIVALVDDNHFTGLLYTERGVHKGVQEYTEYTDSESRLVEIISAVHSACAGQ